MSLQYKRKMQSNLKPLHLPIIQYFIYFEKLKNMFIGFRERGRKKERNIISLPPIGTPTGD